LIIEIKFILYQSNYIKDIYMEIENIHIEEYKGDSSKKYILLTTDISTKNIFFNYHHKGHFIVFYRGEI